MTSEYQLLLEDASYVAGADHSQTIAVEIKLKMGHLPAAAAPSSPPSQVHCLGVMVNRVWPMNIGPPGVLA